MCEFKGSTVKLKMYVGNDVRDLRRKLGLNQREFWAYFQTTQSGGCRYESGREIPKPVQMLLNIAFGTEAKATAIFEAMRGIRRHATPVNATSREGQ